VTDGPKCRSSTRNEVVERQLSEAVDQLPQLDLQAALQAARRGHAVAFGHAIQRVADALRRGARVGDQALEGAGCGFGHGARPCMSTESLYDNMSTGLPVFVSPRLACAPLPLSAS
jgi:hypothetical protein